MITATIGGLIKDYRIKKRLSQLDISLKIGWNDTSRLSKIEQGRVERPTRETLDKIIKALDLNEQERCEFLLASKLLPSHEEIQEAINRLKQKMESFETPVKLIDYAWRTLYFNSHAQKLYKTNSNINSYLIKNKPNWLEILFNQEKYLGVKINESYSLNDNLTLYEHEISQFKYDHMNNTKEKWFIELITKLSKDKMFREKWENIDPNNYENLLQDHEVHTVTGNWNDKNATLKFNEFSVRPTFDFRYYLSVYMPANRTTYEFYQNLLTQR